MSLENFFQQCLSVVCSTSLGFVEKSWHVNFFWKTFYSSESCHRESSRGYTILILSSIKPVKLIDGRLVLISYASTPWILWSAVLCHSTGAQASVVTLRDSVDTCCVTYPGHYHRYFYAWTEREVGTPCNPRTRSKTSRRTIRTSSN